MKKPLQFAALLLVAWIVTDTSLLGVQADLTGVWLAAQSTAVPGPAPATRPVPAPTGPSGRWRITDVAGAPWTFELNADGSSLTGTVQQSGSPNNPMSIAAGKVDGTTISFKVLSPDAERIVTFRGRVNGNEISFAREITALPGGSRGGNDLYGSLAALEFVAKRVASN